MKCISCHKLLCFWVSCAILVPNVCYQIPGTMSLGFCCLSPERFLMDPSACDGHSWREPPQELINPTFHQPFQPRGRETSHSPYCRKHDNGNGIHINNIIYLYTHKYKYIYIYIYLSNCTDVRVSKIIICTLAEDWKDQDGGSEAHAQLHCRALKALDHFADLEKVDQDQEVWPLDWTRWQRNFSDVSCSFV
jgi:hypothetical protein